MKFILTLTAMFILFLASGCSSENQAKEIDDSTTTVQDAQPVTADDKEENISSGFVFETQDLKGNNRSSGEYVGKQPYVINFWGTWCPPCRAEIPELVRVYDEYKSKGVEMIGLTVIKGSETPADVIKFTIDKRMNWEMWLVTKSVAQKYEVTAVPTTIFIDKKGEEVNRLIGPQSYETFKAAFESIL